MALSQELINKLNNLKGEAFLNAVTTEMLDDLPPELSLKWCKERVKISNKINAKLGEENREKEINRLKDEKIKELESNEKN